MRIPYYPGCTLKTTAKGFEDSAIAVAKELGIELQEIPNWICCGTVFSLSSDDLMHLIAPIRNLLRVQQAGEKRVATLCAMCYNTLKQSNERVKENPDELEKLNGVMYTEEEEYKGEVEVYHFLEILKNEIGFDRIREKVKKPLRGFKVAPYYGCLLVRPERVGIDDAENPQIIKELVESLGGSVVDFPYAVECCGSYQTVNAPEVVANRTKRIIDMAREVGANSLVLSCPLCSFNLDARQKDIQEKYPGFLPLPVFYFTQLMALAFGFGKEVCHFDLNSIPVDEVLKGVEV